MRAILLALAFFTIPSSLFSQRDILRSALKEHGTNLKFVKAWTDDEYIVMLTKGTVEKRGAFIFFLIHPEHGILSKYVIDGYTLGPLKLSCSNSEQFTVFYSDNVKLKTVYYSLTFSKTSSNVEVKAIDDEVKDPIRESLFSFAMDGRVLFASATKDKRKFAFREFFSTGEAVIKYEFEMPDTLAKALNLGWFDRDYDRTLYVGKSNIKLLVYRQANKLRIDVFDFDLTQQKLKINSYKEGNGDTFGASFANNHLFVMRTGMTQEQKGNMMMKFYDLSLDIIEYPSFKIVKKFKFDRSNATIPFKTSALKEVIYTSHIYNWKGNYKFRDHENEFNSMGILKAMYDGIPFMNTEATAAGNYRIEMGSLLQTDMTNASQTIVNRVFGCMNSNFEPCKEKEDRMGLEKMLDYLKTVQKEDPDFTFFGTSRFFGAFYFKKRKEIVLMEF